MPDLTRSINGLMKSERLACGSRPPAVHMMRALLQCKEPCE